MDYIFWIGLAIGAILSFAASVVANILHTRITDLLDRRKTVTQSKRYAAATKFHTLIEELHSGKRDKYVYLMGVAVITIVSFSASVALGAALVVLPAFKIQDTGYFDIFGLPDLSNPFDLLTLCVAFLCMIFLSASLLSLRAFLNVASALDDFDEFDAEFKAKWLNPKP